MNDKQRLLQAVNDIINLKKKEKIMNNDVTKTIIISATWIVCIFMILVFYNPIEFTCTEPQVVQVKE